MKKVIVFHGTGGYPDNFWFPWLKKSLPNSEFSVSVPQLPNADYPDIKEWLPFVLEKYKFDKDTILVGHSAGCPLILSILENIKHKIHKSILVAGYIEVLGSNPEPILQEKYDWDKIKQNSEHFVFINSINDPWGCNDKQGKLMLDHLGGDLIISSDQGHMGSIKYNQPYKEFPLVKFLIEN